MGNEIGFDLLMRYHREVLIPEVRQIVREEIGPFRDEVNSHFDAIYARFDRLESEVQSLKAAHNV